MSEDLGLINAEWQRRLVGRKFVKSEDEGFEDLKVVSPFPPAFLGRELERHPRFPKALLLTLA